MEQIDLDDRLYYSHPLTRLRVRDVNKLSKEYGLA